jgi:hypothetical protein
MERVMASNSMKSRRAMIAAVMKLFIGSGGVWWFFGIF